MATLSEQPHGGPRKPASEAWSAAEQSTMLPSVCVHHRQAGPDPPTCTAGLVDSPLQRLPSLSGQRLKHHDAIVGGAQVAGRPMRLVISSEIGLEDLHEAPRSFPPHKSPRTGPIISSKASVAQRPTSSGTSCKAAHASPRVCGAVAYRTSSGKEASAWVEGYVADFKCMHFYLSNTGADGVGERSEDLHSFWNAQGSAERRGPSASVPSTPRRPATREPSVRARRAVLRESNVQWATSHSPARRHRSDGPHVPVSVSGWAAAPPHHSRGSSSGSSSSAPLGKFLPSQTPAQSFSFLHAEARHSTPSHQGDPANQCTWSPRAMIDVSDVSDALKERCTSALSSTLRDMTQLNEKHKTQIMDNYCHEVCAALQDHEGLQRENIFVRHREESHALRSALRLEHQRQKKILEDKLAQRRRNKELAKGNPTASAGGKTAAAPLTSEAADAVLQGNHVCACAGSRRASGECGDCWALRFNVKARDVASVLRAASTLLLRQALVLPHVGERMDAGLLAQQAERDEAAAVCGADTLPAAAQDVSTPHAGQKGPPSLEGGAERAPFPEGSSGRGSKVREARAQPQVQRPPTAVGSRASGEALPHGWVVRTSRSTGKHFYYHSASKKTQWLRPDA